MQKAQPFLSRWNKFLSDLNDTGPNAMLIPDYIKEGKTFEEILESEEIKSLEQAILTYQGNEVPQNTTRSPVSFPDESPK